MSTHRFINRFLAITLLTALVLMLVGPAAHPALARGVPLANPRDVLINEFVATPTSAEAVELCNPTGSDIDVSGWTLNWGYGSATINAGQVVPAGGYLVLTTANAPGLSISNAGTVLSLIDTAATVIDQVGYGDDGAAPKPEYNFSTARVPDCTDTDDDANDFNTDETPTLGAANDGYQQAMTPLFAQNPTPAASNVVTPSADLMVAKQGPQYAVIGEDIVYTVEIINSSASTATNVVLTDTLPLSTTYVADNSGIVPTNPSPGVYAWTLGDVPSLVTMTVNITVTVHPSVTAGTILTNTVEVSTDAAGDDPANNQAVWQTTAYPLVTIYDIQTVADPASNDASPLEGQTVWVEGAVTAQPGEIDNPTRMMVIQDPAGGPFSGLPVFRSSGFGSLTAPEGTQVRVLGTVSEYYGLTELNLSSAPWAVEVLGSGSPLAPQVLPTSGFGDAAPASSEQWEGVLIEFQNATVTNDNLGYGEWYFDDGSGDARADDLGGRDGNLTYLPSNGDKYVFIRGIGWYSFGNYKLQPRANADVRLDIHKPGISKDSPVLVAPGQAFTYTITVANELGYDLNNVVVTDTVPAGTTFAYALDGGVQSGGVVTWSVPSLPYLNSISVRFVVTASLTPTTVINSSYAVAAANFITPTFGAPLGTVVDTELRIHHIQGAGHVSPLVGRFVENVPGEVTALTGSGFYMQDPVPDANDATSEGIYVDMGGSPTVAIGDSVVVSATVDEVYPGGITAGNLPTTQLVDPTVITLTRQAQAAPQAIAPTIIGIGGRIPPQQVIEDDVSGSVETSGVFDPDTDGLDFYESLEGMLVQVNDAVVVGPTSRYGEIAVLSDNGANAGVRSARGGIVISPDDFNPERVIIDDALQPNEPQVDVGDRFSAPIVGVLSYSFGNFKLLNIDPLPAVTPGGLAQETTTPRAANEFTLATFNVENLDPTDPPSKFDGLADIIVNRLLAPDILVLEEIQDSSGPTDDGVVDATTTYTTLIEAITTAGGPTYGFRDIAPQDNMDGGQPGGNIRVGFLFRTDRGISFVDRPGGDATTATTPVLGGSGVELTYSPGRVDPTNSAFDDSRKPLAGEFQCGGQPLIIVGNHFNSKGGDNPLFGRVQPPVRSSEVQRIQQAQVVNDFVDSILALDANARVAVLGDLNDFEFSTPISDVLKADVLTNLVETIPHTDRYTYIFNGNSQVLDQILVTEGFLSSVVETDIVHVDAEFDNASRVSDHDPVLVRFTCGGPTAVELRDMSSEAEASPVSLPLPVASLPWEAVVGVVALALGVAAARRR